MPNPEGEARHTFLNNALTMAEVAFMACLQLAGGGPSKVAKEELDRMGGVIAGLVTLFSAADDRATVRPLAKEELKGGAAREGLRGVALIIDDEGAGAARGFRHPAR